MVPALGQAGGAVVGLAERVAEVEVEVRVDRLEAAVAALQNDMAGVKAGLADVSLRLAKVETWCASLDARLTVVERRLDSIDGRLFAMMAIQVTMLLAILGGFIGVLTKMP